jgi:AcrR family transcriptional regulator
LAEQERAIRTRHAILMAAAKVFEDRGYEAATISEILASSGVTKGALYFHFRSKDDLAQAVLGLQNELPPAPARESKVQELVDTVLLHTYRMETNLLVRAGVRLSMEQHVGLDRSGPFISWIDFLGGLLAQAKMQGELYPHADPVQTAEVIVGSYGGVQSLSQALSDYQDLSFRVVLLLRHLLTSAVVS